MMNDIKAKAAWLLDPANARSTYPTAWIDELAQAVLSAEPARCPHIVSSGSTQWCDLAARGPEQTTVDPDMPAQQLRMHLGEMTAQEMRTARAAIRWANSARMQPVTAQEFSKAIDEVRLCISSSRRGGNGLRNADELYEALGRDGIRLVRE